MAFLALEGEVEGVELGLVLQRYGSFYLQSRGVLEKDLRLGGAVRGSAVEKGVALLRFRFIKSERFREAVESQDVPAPQFALKTQFRLALPEGD